MEKYSQFRDRGSGISPFIPSSTPTSTLQTLLHPIVFLFRLPLFLSYCAVYFLFLAPLVRLLHLPLACRKLLLWGMLGIPGVWWVDLQLDGVKRGSLSQQPPSRVPHPKSVIAAQFTSPVDALYLAAIFDPVFAVSYPRTRKVRRVSLFQAIALALSPPALEPSVADVKNKRLTTLRALIEQNPHRVVAVFPEMSTTNGKGILPFSPSLLSAPAEAKIFPVSMRYTPADITTPVPGAYATFLWNLLSRPTHCIKVRIADAVINTPASKSSAMDGVLEEEEEEEADEAQQQGEEDLTLDEKKVLDRVGEDLARLARNKRVGLTLRDKVAFIDAWNKGRK